MQNIIYLQYEKNAMCFNQMMLQLFIKMIEKQSNMKVPLDLIQDHLK